MQPTTIPHAHASFLERALPLLQADSRIVGVAAAGSFASGAMDEFSDVDLTIAVEPDSLAAVLAERKPIAAQLGPLLAAFTGEHVGEPRLLICLYQGEDGEAPLHVDLKFLAVPDVSARVDEPVVLWEREGRVSAALATGTAQYPAPDLSWIEDRFWVWVHYAALKIGRGELFEVVGFLAFLRQQVLGPLALVEAGAQPAGVRRLEWAAPERARQLCGTVAGHDRESCLRSVHAAVEMYLSLRTSVGADGLERNEAAERAVMAFLADIASR